MLNDIQNSSKEYYIGIGKSDVFDNFNDNPTVPVNSLFEEKEFRNNFFGSSIGGFPELQLAACGIDVMSFLHPKGNAWSIFFFDQIPK